MIERILTYGDVKYLTQDFESMFDVAQYLSNLKDLDKYSLTKDSLLSEESDFYGISTFEGMLDRLKYGDETATKYFLDKLNSKSEEGEELSNIKMDIEGFAYDMGAVVNGEPECCLNFGQLKIKPHLNIYIDIGYCGSVTQEIIANRGVAIYQLISNLLAKGYILDIWIVHYITITRRDLYCQRIKFSTEYLTVSQLAFAGRCEFFRVITWLLTAIQIKEYCYDGDGKSKPIDCVIKELKKDGLYIPSGYTDERFNDCTRNQAFKYIIDIYNNYKKEN